VVKEITEDNQLQMEMVFPTSVYLIKKPAFLDRARSAAAKALKNAKAMNQPNEAYPVCHSTNLLEHAEIAELAEYIGSTGWNILESQGYKMDDKEVFSSPCGVRSIRNCPVWISTFILTTSVSLSDSMYWIALQMKNVLVCWYMIPVRARYRLVWMK
jgi:hypothetical protein